MNRKVALTGIALGTLACLGAFAQTNNWTGNAGNSMWTNNENWSAGTQPNSYSTDVAFTNNNNLASDYGVSLGSSRGIRSLTVDISRFALISSNSKTMRFASNGSITFGNSFTSRGNNGTAFSSTSSNHRLWVNAQGDLTLRNNGTGEASFSFASLQNDNNSTADSTFTFEGSGDWAFRPASYLGRQSKAHGSEFDSAYKVSVLLKNDGTNSFTGTLRYEASRTAQLHNLTVDSGTFTLVKDSAVNVSGLASVGLGGTLVAAGTLEGNAAINGSLIVGEGNAADRFTVNGDLLLGQSAKTTVHVFAASADSISSSGQLTLDGQLIINIDAFSGAQELATNLYGDFNSIVGNFTSVILGGIELEQSGTKWTGSVNNLNWTFDAATGDLSAIPEASTVALILGGTALAFCGFVRRRRAHR